MIRSQKGFTLIELILVIAILAIITAIATPSILFGVRDARRATDKANARLIANSMQQVITKENGIHRVDISPPLAFQADVPDATVDTIEDLIETSAVELQSVPQIKYGDNKGTNFYVEIGVVTGVMVYTDIDPDAGNVVLVELYPTPSGDWAD